MKTFLRSLLTLGVVALLTGVSADVAFAQKKGLSDRSVKVLMDYAWAILPGKFTTPSGKVIKVDKTKREPIMVPVDVARSIVSVARLSAHAQICKLPEAQAANYRTMMRDQKITGNWTDQQMLYVSQLHLFTVMWLTGNVRIQEEKDGKKIELKSRKDRKEQTCSEEQRVKVAAAIGKYVKETQERLKKSVKKKAATASN